MILQYLRLSDFRNVEQAELELDPELNVIQGLNAAGKTSLLEAIFFLSSGRSFRSNTPKDLIRSGCEQSIIRLQVHDGEQNIGIGCGIYPQARRLRVNGQDASGQSMISRLVPVVLFSPEQAGMVHGDPEVRRRWLDWGVFHVKQEYADLWKQHQRILKQRNQALKRGCSNVLLDSIDHQFLRLGNQLDELRRSYLDELTPQLLIAAEQTLGETSLKLKLRSGWAQDSTLEDQLNVSRETDRRLGFTRNGAHRADIAVFWGGDTAKSRVSRGQERLLSLLFKLIQLKHFHESLGYSAVFMLDDYTAELDQYSQGKLMNLLFDTPAQLLVTALEGQNASIAEPAGKRFHVEHGVCQELL